MPLEVEMSERFCALGDDDALPHILEALDQTPQRTPAWFKRRSHRLSGSKLSQLLFIQDADQLAVYREEVLGLRPRPPLDERGKKNVKWGIGNEPNATATTMHHMKDIRVWDMGFEIHPTHEWFGSSPDGVVHWPGLGYGALEIKCSTKINAKGVNVPHQGVPAYYIGQLHAEMRCMPIANVNWTLFVSWSTSKTKMYMVHFDEAYFAILWDVMIDFMAGDMPFEAWKAKQDMLRAAGTEVARKAELIGVFDSCVLKGTKTHLPDEDQ